MLERHFTLTITANVVAWYAAVVATLSAAIQTANYLRDRVSVKISFQRDMKTMGDLLHDGMKLTFVRVVNTGRRPLTITNMGLTYLKGGGETFTDWIPRLPCVLTEGQQVQALVDETGLHYEDVRAFEAYDAAGRTFRIRVAPWHKRLIWFLRRAAGPRVSKNA
jgi:hypothetical protein